ncbi:transglutaminaseTgpA domain-containing protein [Actinocorallia longicatena]|uniref:DUF3488 and transglutaminase-like domain-containing protein n=1 Tax=Actinocorallia longicatena TaxID=111803 RepID=A0ABP6QU95_9ACTN
MSTRPGLTAMAAAATLLGSISLYPLFKGAAWVAPGIGAILVVSGAGMLVRRYRLPAALNLVGALAALNLYLTAVYTGGQAILLFIPGPESLRRMIDLLREGWDTAETFAAPLPDGEGVRLMSTLGIGITAAVVDLIAVRLRRAAPAGLPLLAMYSVPAAVRVESVSWLAFAAGAGGYLALLVADARDQVTSWGRPVFTRRWNETETGERADARPMTSAGRRVGLAAIGIAVLIPAVLPGITSKGMFGLGGHGPGDSQTITTADPLVDLKRRLVELKDEEVLTYKTTAQRPEYLRRYSLDKFDGNRWTYSPLVTPNSSKIKDGSIPLPIGQVTVRSVEVTTEVSVSGKVKDMDFLPVPYAPSRLEISGGDWRADDASLMLFSTNAQAGGKTYKVVSDLAQPTPQELELAGTADTTGYLDVPDTVPAEVVRLARQITKGRQTPYKKAMALQTYFLKNFTYSLVPDPPSRMSNLQAFLKDRRGYCEQFAATMALMARMVDIPARVAVGFAPGTPLGGNRYSVKQKDSHAWPELFFPGSGWVRFEPTPGGPGAPSSVGVPPWATPQARQGATPEPSASAAPLPSTGPDAGATPSGGPDDPRNRFDKETGLPLDQKKHDGPPVGWILGVLAVLLLAAVPFLLSEGARRYRWSRVSDPSSAARAAWSQLRADALDHGLPWSAAETPRSVQKKLADGVPAASVPLARIAHAQELARYARPGHPVPGDPRTLHDDNRAVRTALSASADRKTRLRARVLPPSAMDALKRATEKTFDAVEGFRRR